MLSVLLVVSLFCKDVWGSSVDGCRDLDAGRVYDTDGRACDFYDAKPDQCALFDDPDFHAGDLCCACNGGEKGTSSSTTIFRGTRPPRQTNANSTPNRRTTAPPRDEPRGGIDTTKATQQGCVDTTGCGQSCDDYIAKTPSLTCAILETMKCNCNGCNCASTSTSATTTPSTSTTTVPPCNARETFVPASAAGGPSCVCKDGYTGSKWVPKIGRWSGDCTVKHVTVTEGKCGTGNALTGFECEQLPKVLMPAYGYHKFQVKPVEMPYGCVAFTDQYGHKYISFNGNPFSAGACSANYKCLCRHAPLTTTPATTTTTTDTKRSIRDQVNGWLHEGTGILGSIFNHDDDTPVVVHGRNLRVQHSES